MVDYTNNNIIQFSRQYEMFANSLEMLTDPKDRDSICHQLDKLERKIIEGTNSIYEEEYNTLLNRDTYLFEEEKTRLTLLIDLINQRLNYVENRKNNHKLLVGHEIEYPAVLGEDTLVDLEDRIKIINKYTNNIQRKAEIKEELEVLNNKIKLAEEKIRINESLNDELETKMIDLLKDAFTKLDLFKLEEEKAEIKAGYDDLKYSLELASENVKMAESADPKVLLECRDMENSVRKDYDVYNEKISILELIDIYDEPVSNYNELLSKREKINDIFQNIEKTEIYSYVSDEVIKQYNTIKIEGQDIKTYEAFVTAKEDKEKILREIEIENNSPKFKEVLNKLIENEKIKKEQERLERKRLLEEETKKKRELEKKRQEEILKRQKLIEENRKKEIEERTKQLLEEKERSVLNSSKLEKTNNNLFSFETIKNKINLDEESEARSKKIDVTSERVETEGYNKNKEEIEKDLFKEFNNAFPVNKTESSNNNDTFWTEEETNILESDDFPTLNDEKIDMGKMTSVIPDGDFDDYMKNFNDEKNDFFSDNNAFPEFPE